MASGAASGLFGIGGGVVAVPFLLFLTGATFSEAVAASLFVMVLTVPLGVWTHHRAGAVRWRMGLALSAGGLAGVAAATAAQPWLPEGSLQWAFAALLVQAAHHLAYGSGTPLLRLGGSAQVALAGVLGGLVAKLLGIGGGILMVPALVFGGFTMHAAVATSLVAVFANGLVSTGINWVRLGPGEWVTWGLALSVGAIVGTWLGSRTAIRSHGDSLRRAFALLLLWVSLGLVLRTVS